MKFLMPILALLALFLTITTATPIETREVNSTAWYGPPDPVFDLGYPVPECPDVDYCFVRFYWRLATWEAPHGICALCKKLQANGWRPVPYNVWPAVMEEGLCKKWQPPNSYTCQASRQIGFRRDPAASFGEVA